MGTLEFTSETPPINDQVIQLINDRNNYVFAILAHIHNSKPHEDAGDYFRTGIFQHVLYGQVCTYYLDIFYLEEDSIDNVAEYIIRNESGDVVRYFRANEYWYLITFILKNITVLPIVAIDEAAI